MLRLADALDPGHFPWKDLEHNAEQAYLTGSGDNRRDSMTEAAGAQAERKDPLVLGRDSPADAIRWMRPPHRGRTMCREAMTVLQKSARPDRTRMGVFAINRNRHGSILAWTGNYGGESARLSCGPQLGKRKNHLVTPWANITADAAKDDRRFQRCRVASKLRIAVDGISRSW